VPTAPEIRRRGHIYEGIPGPRALGDAATAWFALNHRSPVQQVNRITRFCRHAQSRNSEERKTRKAQAAGCGESQRGLPQPSLQQRATTRCCRQVWFRRCCQVSRTGGAEGASAAFRAPCATEGAIEPSPPFRENGLLFQQ